jgi:hypothetical protein
MRRLVFILGIVLAYFPSLTSVFAASAATAALEAQYKEALASARPKVAYEILPRYLPPVGPIA